MFEILKFRNQSEAFDGEIKIVAIDESAFEIQWTNQEVTAILKANLKERHFTIIEKTESQRTYYFDSQEGN